MSYIFIGGGGGGTFFVKMAAGSGAGKKTKASATKRGSELGSDLVIYNTHLHNTTD